MAGETKKSRDEAESSAIFPECNKPRARHLFIPECLRNQHDRARPSKLGSGLKPLISVLDFRLAILDGQSRVSPGFQPFYM